MGRKKYLYGQKQFGEANAICIHDAIFSRKAIWGAEAIWRDRNNLGCRSNLTGHKQFDRTETIWRDRNNLFFIKAADILV